MIFVVIKTSHQYEKISAKEVNLSKVDKYQNTKDLRQCQTEVYMCAVSNQDVAVREDQAPCLRWSQGNHQQLSFTRQMCRRSTRAKVHFSNVDTCQESQHHPYHGPEQMEAQCQQMLKYCPVES